MKDAINLNVGVDVYFGYNENDSSQINCVVSKVYEKAADYNIDVTSDVITNVVTGKQELVFNFRKKGKRVDAVAVVDESEIHSIKDIDFIVNGMIEKMKYLL